MGVALSAAAIDAEGLCRGFGDRLALDQFTLRVPSGIVFGLLGPNGAGKTTAIRVLLGLLEATGGRARVLGLDVTTEADAIRANTGALLEYTGLYERLTAVDNLEFYGRVWQMRPVERRDRIRDLLTSFSLWDRRGDIVARWSRGMKQKLAIARAMLHRPSLLFLDEPTTGLDPVASAALRSDLATLVAKEKVTVFLTTHNLVDAETLCAQIGVMGHGRLLATGAPADVRAGAGSLADAFHALVREAS
jgi:ABC-2 type transport system ATP-binding protein